MHVTLLAKQLQRFLDRRSENENSTASSVASCVTCFQLGTTKMSRGCHSTTKSVADAGAAMALDRHEHCASVDR